MKRTVSGYVMILTLVLAAVAISTVTYLARKNLVYTPLTHKAADREKANLLALGGIELACSQLAGSKPNKKDAKKAVTESQQKESSKKEAVDSVEKRMLAALIPANGRWQTFSFDEKRDGMSGTVQICITSEEGKIDINALYNFKEKKFVGSEATTEDKNYRMMLEKVLARVEDSIGASNLMRGLEAFLKGRDKPLSDVTELLSIKEFAPFKQAVFYEPVSDKKAITLTDLFTVWNGTRGLTAWLLSPSLQRIMGATQLDVKKLPDEAIVKKIVDNYGPTITLKQAWQELLAPLYGIELASLPTYAKAVLGTRFGPRFFSVLSYGVVGTTTQKLLAIIMLEEDSSPDSDAAYSVVMKKLYWL